MVKDGKWLPFYRLFFSGLAISAVVTEIVTLTDRGTFNPVNFFSFFTIGSNIFAALVFLTAAVAHFVKRSFVWLPLLRGAATLYMLTTGIVFALLLSGQDAQLLTAVPWDNTVLHYLMPVAVLADWLLDPPKAAISFKKALWWLVYPVIYLCYSLVRGSITDWYPYPFLNPVEKGYAGVLVVCVGVAAMAIFLIWLIIGVRPRIAPRKTRSKA